MLRPRYQAKRRSQTGLTLIEMMLAALIVSLISTALYGVFSNGIRVWYRALALKPEFELSLLLEKMESDLRNALAYGKIPIKGTANSMELYSMTSSLQRKGVKESVSFPERIKYEFGADIGGFYRSNLNYLDVITKREKNVLRKKIAEKVKKCSFQYYKKSNQLQARAWQSSWSEPCMPDAIKVSLEYAEGRETKGLSKILQIPAGGCAA